MSLGPRRWWTPRLALCAMIIGCLGLWAGWPMKTAEATILINEFLADPNGDANGDGALNTTQDEFVELLNAGGIDLSLASWTLSDLIQVRHTFSAGSVIPAGSFFVVFGGGSPSGFTSYATASTGTLSLNNTGDTLFLRDAGGLLINQVSYGSEGNQNTSLTRNPDGEPIFVKHTTVNSFSYSPGTTVDGNLQLPTAEPPPLDLPQPTIPEPATMCLAFMGLVPMLGLRRATGEGASHAA